jgi:branched-chain amino acid transport system permease protein
MDLALHAQLLTVGISIGWVYALVALGFLLIYNGVGAINFAQGDLVMVGAFVAVTAATSLGVSPVATLLVVVVAAGLLGYFFGRLLYIPVRDKPFAVFIIVTVGMSILMANAAQIIWGPAPITMPSLSGDRMFSLGGAVVPADYIIVGLVSIVTLAALYCLFMYSFTGRQLRAVATDRQTAELVGIHVGVMTSVAFVLSAIMSGVAGFLIAPMFFAIATMGPPLGIKAFVAIVIGGFGNMVGAVVGGVLVGVLESYVGYYISSAYKEAIIYAVLIAVLLVKPMGLFGEAIDEKV